MLLGRFILAFVLSVFSCASLAMADPCMNKDNYIQENGECWLSLSFSEKSDKITGIWTGLKIARLNANFNGNRIVSIFRNYDFTGLPEATNVGDIVDYFDKLYSYPVNRNIDWRYAYILSALNAKDDDSNDRLSLVRFLRDYKELPTIGVWIETKSIDRIVVSVDGQNLEVKLAGVSSSGVSEETKATALNVLNKLMFLDWLPCTEEPTRATVALTYPDDLFYEDGTLTASVEVYGLGVCLNERAVTTQELYGSSISDFILNDFLLRKGLARPEGAYDPQWSKERRDTRKWATDYMADEAVKSALYDYGGKTEPAIEFISSNGKTSF